ncbi:MAG: hypothetical protein F6K54_06625 [Okeania sp. SIO3B5]|nr:hypothetical protein [Okeania sp. SIO3B5]NEO52778.1 hypothetical protein [Okeania sp. SIO3B5]
MIDLDFDKKRAIIFVEKFLKMAESRYSKLEKAVSEALGEDFISCPVE